MNFRIEGDGISLIKRKCRGKNENICIDRILDKNKDVIVFNKEFPEFIQYRFKRKTDVKESVSKMEYFGIGGPLGFIGSRSGRLHSEIGWEPTINITQVFSILPSISTSFHLDGYYDWNAGLRAYFMGLSVGAIYREENEMDYSLGIDVFGPIGLEFRTKGWFIKLSI